MSNSFSEDLMYELKFQVSTFNSEVVKCTNNHAEKLLEKIKADSPEKTGRYKKNWKLKKSKKESNSEAIVYNDEPTYRVAHLLEKGHDYVSYVGKDWKRVENKRIKDAAKPKSHILENADKEKEEWLKDLEEIGRR